MMSISILHRIPILIALLLTAVPVVRHDTPRKTIVQLNTKNPLVSHWIIRAPCDEASTPSPLSYLLAVTQKIAVLQSVRVHWGGGACGRRIASKRGSWAVTRRGATQYPAKRHKSYRGYGRWKGYRRRGAPPPSAAWGGGSGGWRQKQGNWWRDILRRCTYCVVFFVNLIVLI